MLPSCRAAVTRWSLTISTDNVPQPPTVTQPEDSKPADSSKDSKTASTNAPLAPPPRPTQNNDKNGDYLGPGGGHPHEGNSYFSKEPNPFENAFGAPSDTPGKTQLPGVTSLTSPAPLGLSANTPGWPNSLRSGPLSPAMLTGPANNDYFSNDHHFAGSFPTPNESSLRTGLTPGGGGSMFPQPSPNSQAIFNSLQSGGATPGTLDFHRTAMHARAANHVNNSTFAMPQNPASSQPQESNIQPGLDTKGFNGGQQQQQQQQQREQFESHDANDAANGLFMLAQARGNQSNQQQQQSQQQQQYPAPSQQSQMNYMPNTPHMQNQNQSQRNAQDRLAKNSVTSHMSGSTENGEGDYGEDDAETKPSGRSRGGKKGSAGKANKARKAEETPSKGNNKRQKGNSGSMIMPPDDDEDSEEEEEPQVGADGRKLTDEEKRKNFLERNRIAALKCRQRKKQWLANLQQKVEIFSSENDALASTVTQLREEIVGLKTLLLAHKDCPVSQAQGISGMAMQNIAGEPQQFGNPYSMGMQGMQQHSMQQANMQRR